MTDEDLKQNLFNMLAARGLTTGIFYTHGSVRNTAMLAAGMSIGLATEYTDGEDPWDRHYATTKWLEHFDDSPGTLSASLLLGIVFELDPHSLRFSDVRKAADLIHGNTPGVMLDRYKAWLIDQTSVPCAVLQNIIFVHETAALATVVNKPEYFIGPVATRILDKYRKHSDQFDDANPVLRSIHLDILNSINPVP